MGIAGRFRGRIKKKRDSFMEVSQKPFTRKKPDQLVYLELGASNGGMLLSISEDGFRFRAVTPLRPNLPMPFAFSLDGNNRLEGTGVIEDLEEDARSGGMRFTDVSDQFRSSLRVWLGSQPSATFTGREATAAASTPLDSMEKIRHELRNGYRNSSRQAAPAATAAAPAPDTGPVAPEIISQISTPALSEKPAKPVVAESKSELHEIKSPIGISETLPKQTEPATSAKISSAFLKTRGTAKAAPCAFQIPAVQAISNEPVISSAPRPYVPPLEPSFEQAWVQVKLNVPPDPPRLSRAASGSIIAVALAVILGALGYNFRQTIGGLLIELGQAISGENHSSATAPAQEPKADKPPDVQNAQAQNLKESPTAPQNSAAEKGAAPASSETPAGVSSNNPATPDSTPAKPSANLSPAPPVNPSGKSSESTVIGAGQEEFNTAQGILRGNNKQRDLLKAVDLLWAGVKKGYVPAEVTLGDLYRRGEGVPKNCAQATVLLTAASKKGSSDARKMLEQVAEKGCK
jgi:hypothetical protein